MFKTCPNKSNGTAFKQGLNQKFILKIGLVLLYWAIIFLNMKFAFQLVWLWLALSQPALAGQYLEYKIHLQNKYSGVVKTWYQDGHSRSEINIPGVPMGMGNMVAITLRQKPEVVYVLNEQEKTYMEMSGTAINEEADEKEILEVKMVGNEKANGYQATHIVVKRKGQKFEEHLWVSKELKGYQEFKKMRGKYLTDDKVMKAYEAKGIEGFPVKMMVETEEGTVSMDLLKAEELAVPASKFSLSGYEKSAALPMMPGGMDLEKLKNMSPEDRQRMVEQLMKQYGR